MGAGGYGVFHGQSCANLGRQGEALVSVRLGCARVKKKPEILACLAMVEVTALRPVRPGNRRRGA
jgi:hypothetical protein